MSYYAKKILGSLVTGGGCGLVLWAVYVGMDKSYGNVDTMLRFVIPSAIATAIFSVIL